MDAIEPQGATIAETDPRWIPRGYPRDELLRGLIEGGQAGVVSHPMDNVLWKIGLLCEGDSVSQFGLSGVSGLSSQEVLRLVADASGFQFNPAIRWGPVVVSAEPVLDACLEAGDRLAEACRRGERVAFATGHPHGLTVLYAEVGRQIERRGARILRPRLGFGWSEGVRRPNRRLAYLDGVAVVVHDGSPIHTHSAVPMRHMLEEVRPDLVVADHGLAGATVEAGVETISVADVNDPALIVAKAQGRTRTVIVMDDNVRPESYWPCFQAIVSRLP